MTLLKLLISVLCNKAVLDIGPCPNSTDTDPNTGKNRRSPIFRYSSEFRYSSCGWH